MSKAPEEEKTFSFFQDLQVKLALEAAGKKAEVFSNNIEKVKLHLHNYGFDAEMHFTTFDQEEMSQLFTQKKMMKAALTFASTKESTPLLEIKGIVYERDYEPRPKGIQKKKVRHFKIRFTDPAHRSWNVHFPTRIFVDETMKNVIDAEKNPLVSLKYDWEVLDEVSPIIAFSLTQKKQVSFYSFLMWYLEQAGGVFQYNYKEHDYSILGKKNEEGEPVAVPEWETRFPSCRPPEPKRHHTRTIKLSTESEDFQDEENPEGFKSVRDDFFDDANYPLYPERLTQASHSAATLDKPLIQFSLARFTETFGLSHILPGVLIAIKGEEKLGGDWSEDPEVKDQTFRIRDVSFEATKTVVSDGIQKNVQPFRLEVSLTAESKDEPFVSRPAFKDPVYPFSTIGKIFSEIGDKEQTTYNIVKNEKSPLGMYQVVIPRAGKDKKVLVPFTPDGTSGRNHLPHTKNLGVRLDMYFQAAKIVEVVEFTDLTQPSPDTQIQQTVLASNGKDKYVRQKHEFKGKESTYTFEHSTSAEQKQLIEVQEQKILITVIEKGKTLSAIEINRKPLGVTITVKDDDQGSTQQFALTPAGNVLTSEGKSGKTTITQTSDTVSIETKKFMVKCEEGTIEAQKTLTSKAGSKHIIDAPLTTAKKFKAN
ncbi:MAG: hypothetical protein JSS10_01625 [Verrucomicrobia bacterium]|nr:hypothetical protein [Verrucomicrobiota bacterium]